MMEMTDKKWVVLESDIASEILEGPSLNILDQLHTLNNWEDANKISHRHKDENTSSVQRYLEYLNGYTCVLDSEKLDKM